MSAATSVESSTVKHPAATEPLIELLDELRQLSIRAGRHDLAGRVGMARARISDPRVRVVVVGEPKRGMSTLVNGMVGAEVSATNSGASVPVIVEHGETLTTTIVRAVGNGRTERQRVDPNNPAATLGQPASGIVRAEFTVPNGFLAEGVVLMDSPGMPTDDPHRASTTLSMLAAADAALYVSDGSHEYSPAEMGYLQQIHQICPTVICVLNKIDVHPQWQGVQQANRRLLDAAGLNFAIFPVSSGMRDYANRSGDQQLDIESGVPQLVDYLREHVLAQADHIARTSARNDIRAVSDHLAMALRAESDTLRDPRRQADITERLQAARENADQLRQRSAHWQTALADGYTELITDVEHDLRHRLRSLVREAEAHIMKTDPVKTWEPFRNRLNTVVAEAVSENFVMAHTRSVDLADQVASKFPAEDRIVTLPELHLENADAVLEPVAPLEDLDSAKASVTSLVLSSLRGSYGGILMVGLATSALAGLALLNWWSAGAGVLLGAHAVVEERKARKQRRQAEAKVAVARLMDDVVFQVSKESRFRLRSVHRTLRDHFTEIATEALRSVDESLRAAEEAGSRHLSHREERIADIDMQLDTLSRLRRHADALVTTA